MRTVLLAAVLTLSACASIRPAPTDPVAVAAAEDAARADSLLALPPDSLSAADHAWLAAHAVRREARVAADDALLGALVVTALVGFFVYALATRE